MGKNSERVKRLQNVGVLPAVLTLAAPVVAQSLLQVLIGTVDLKMVGALGRDAIAAVGMGRQIIMIVMILVMAISTGATALVARNVGKGDQRAAARAAGDSFTLVWIFALVMTVVGILTARPTLQLLGATEEVMELSIGYMRIFYLSIVFFLSNFMARSIFQGAGDTKTPLYIDIVMNLANVLFNYLFIYGVWIFPELGVAGAALGSAIARFIGCVLGWGALLSGRFALHLTWKDLFGFDTAGMKRILGIGIPAAFQGLARNISNIVIVAMLARTTAEMVAISAFTVGMNINQYALMPGLAVGTAAAALTGINIGAGNPHRAEQSGWVAAGIGAGIMGFFGLVSFIFAPWLLAFFSDDPGVIAVGVVFVRVISISEPFHALGIILSRSMQGAGYTFWPFVITTFSWVVIRVPLAWLLAFSVNWQSTGIWIALSATYILSGVLAVSLYRRGTWKGQKLAAQNLPGTA